MQKLPNKVASSQSISEIVNKVSNLQNSQKDTEAPVVLQVWSNNRHFDHLSTWNHVLWDPQDVNIDM